MLPMGSKLNLVGRKCMDSEVRSFARLDPGGGCEKSGCEAGWCRGSMRGPVGGCR